MGRLRSLLIPGVDKRLLVRDAGNLMPDPTRRRFIAGGASLGALTLLTGCDVSDSFSAEEMLKKHPEIIGVQTTVGIGSTTMQITMVDPNQRKVTQNELSATIRKELGQIPGVKVSVQDLSQQGFGALNGQPRGQRL